MITIIERTIAISILIDVGRSADCVSPRREELLARIAAYDDINRLGPRDWYSLCDGLDPEQLGYLAKGMVIAEEHHHWIGGSVAGAIWVFKAIEKASHPSRDEIAEWMLKHTTNPYVPFGTQNFGPSSLAEYRERVAAKRTRHRDHLEEEDA